jgi:hydroxylamine reductase
LRLSSLRPGFTEDGSVDEITIGFGHSAVLSVADCVIQAVKSGAIRRFFLISGCEGARSGRRYYRITQNWLSPFRRTAWSWRWPAASDASTSWISARSAVCLLDFGQCNHTYSALQIALALAKAFDCGLNDLPLSLVLSWYEQKAAAVLPHAASP